MTELVEFNDDEFHVAERVGLMPLMKFAMVAQSGVDANELDGLAAMYELLEQCIDPPDWDRFVKHATKSRASGDELNDLIGRVMVIVGNRPTGRSSVSSDGPRVIEPSSTGDSSSPATARVIEMFNQEGRPDLALLVRKRQESLTG